MQIDEFNEQITRAHRRVIDLERTSDHLSITAVVTQSFEELHVAFEELHAAQEELRQQQSELLASQAGLEAERRRYQELFDFAPDGYLVTDLHGVIREANFAAASLLGAQRGFLLGVPLARYLADDEARRQFFAYLRLIRQTSDVHEWDERLQPVRGPAFAATLRVAAVHDSNGEVQELRWLLRDITIRKRAEEQVRALNAELDRRVAERTAQLEAASASAVETLALLDTLLEAAPVGLAFWDSELRYVRCNAALARIDGVAADEHYGRTIAEILPRLAGAIEPLLRDVLATGAAAIDREISHAAPAPPYEQRHWLMSYYPVRTPGGAMLGVGGVAVDITDRERAARQALQEREAFLSIAAHELRAPLTTIYGYTNLLHRQMLHTAGITDWDRRALETLRAEVLRLTDRVDVLLDLGRIETGQFDMRPRLLDLTALIAQIVATILPTLELHTLHSILPNRSLMVSGDPVRLEQVIHNLLQNALKYSRAGSAVTIRVSEGDGQACIAVTDQGIGIPKPVQALLFQRFYRANSAGDQARGGLGIGLYVVKEIVQAHGGSVAVESEEDRGSTFMVYLPLARSNASQSTDEGRERAVGAG